MSFLGGPECSTSNNPLNQFQKHVQDDRTLQRDRLVNRGPAGALSGFRSTGTGPAQDEALNAFLTHSPGFQQEVPLQTGHQLRLHSPQADLLSRASSASPSWASDFHAGPPPLESTYKPPPGVSQFGADDLAHFHRMNPAASSSRSSPLPYAQDTHQRPMLGVGTLNPPMGYGMMNRPMYHQPMYGPQQQQPIAVEDKGKGKVVDLDDHQWEEQFAQLDLYDQQAKEEQGVGAAAAASDLEQADKTMQSETSHTGDFESIWKGIQAEAAASKSLDDEQIDQWPSEFNDFSDLGRFSDPVAEDYIFEEDNLFLGAKDAFEQGERIVKEGGNLSLAALAFEAAIQQRPDHVEAWVYLGSVQAQNEKETAAIRAHEQASAQDPRNLAALMGLAVSYTNEGYESKAYHSLERWLYAKYPQVLQEETSEHNVADLGFVDRTKLHERVTQSFIRAAQLSPGGEQMDPDVQVGLGVLFYGAEQYEKAVDCFQSALDSSQMGASNQREQVHLLWNRLGATLANSGRPEEAVAAYQQALSLHPNFVRARYNLGVSCINMNCPEEAASHFLAALDMHKTIEKSGRSQAYEILGDAGSASGADNPALDEQLDRMTSQNMSTTLYETLRRVFNQMGRQDLVNKAVVGVDPEVFRPEFDF